MGSRRRGVLGRTVFPRPGGEASTARSGVLGANRECTNVSNFPFTLDVKVEGSVLLVRPLHNLVMG